MVRIRVIGADRRPAKLGRVEGAIKAGVQAGAKHLQGKINRAPRIRRGRMDFKNRRQLIGFLMALRKGRIEVPYRRGQSPGSETLSKKWTMRTENDGYRAIVGAKVSYGPFVQDEEKQSAYHKQTGWPTVQGVARDEGEKVGKLVQKAIHDALN